VSIATIAERHDVEDALSAPTDIQTQLPLNAPPSLVHVRITEFANSLRLSAQEAAVLSLAAGSGLHRKETAERLGCRPGTVDTYWRRILRKSGYGSKLELFSALLSFSLNQQAQAALSTSTAAALAADAVTPAGAATPAVAGALHDLGSYREAAETAANARPPLGDGLLLRPTARLDGAWPQSKEAALRR